MVPVAIVPVAGLPLTATGKLDRTRLGTLHASMPAEPPPEVLPASPLEQRISEIWRKVLGIERVAVTDNFFDLGGNSLHIVLVHRELCELFGCDVSIVDLFHCPTVQTVAEFVQGFRSPGISIAHINERARQQACALEEQTKRYAQLTSGNDT
jgi:acyl carrier protein